MTMRNVRGVHVPCARCEGRRDRSGFLCGTCRDAGWFWCSSKGHVVRAEDSFVTASRCKECHRETGRLTSDAFRDRVAAIKEAAGCFDCGYAAHPAALDFDHLPGSEKSFCIGQGARYPWATVLAEMAKCEVVCSNCHRVRTAERRK